MKIFVPIFSIILGGSISMSTISKDQFDIKKPSNKITYQAGTNAFTGITIVNLQSNGKVTVTSQVGAKTEKYEGKVEESQFPTINKVINELIASPKMPSDYKPVPDETRIRIEYKSGNTIKNIEFWQNQAESHKAMRAVMEQFQAIAKSISGNKVRY